MQNILYGIRLFELLVQSLLLLGMELHCLESEIDLYGIELLDLPEEFVIVS